MPRHPLIPGQPTPVNGVAAVQNSVYASAPIPEAYLPRGSALARTDRHEILSSALDTMYLSGQRQPDGSDLWQDVPGRSNPSVSREPVTFPRLTGLMLPPWGYRPHIFYRNYGPAVKYLTGVHTVFLIDDSRQMSRFWPEVEACVVECISAIIDKAEMDYVSPTDYFPYDEVMREEKEEVDDGTTVFKEFPTISLQFLRSPQQLRSIMYSETATHTFRRPHIDRAPLGNRILEVLNDLFPDPRPGTPDEIPIQIIIPTAGYTTDEPEDNVNALLMGLDDLNIRDEKFNITMYQVGSDLGAAAKLEAYEMVYNTSSFRRDLVYAEGSLSGETEAIGNGPLSPRKLFKAVERGLEIRGTM